MRRTVVRKASLSMKGLAFLMGQVHVRDLSNTQMANSQIMQSVAFLRATPSATRP